MPHKPYPTDVSDEEWSFATPYLTLMDQHALQREHDLREVFNALRWLVRAGAPWRMLPNDLPPWEAVYQQSRRWLDAGCFEAKVSDLRSIISVAQGRQGQPSAVVMDGRTLQSSCQSGPRAVYDGHKRKRGSKVHMAWTPWSTYWRCMSRQPTNRSAPRCSACAKTFSRPRAIPCNWHELTRDTRMRLHPRQRRTTGSTCRS
jgi:transposase